MLLEADLIAKRATLRWLAQRLRWLLRLSVLKQSSKQQRKQLYRHLPNIKMER